MPDGSGGGPARATTQLICHVCGNVIRCTATELTEYIRRGWPRCCGETMALSDVRGNEAKPPEKKD